VPPASLATVFTHNMCVKKEVVEVVELLVLVLEVEVVVVVLVELVDVVVVVVVADGVVVAELVLVFVVVGTCCCTNGSLLWKLEYLSAGETTIGCPPASATDSAVVATLACRKVLDVAAELPPPNPRHPESMSAHPATRTAPPRRCRCRCSFILSVPYFEVLAATLLPGVELPAAAAGCPFWSMQNA
jgi:hypothetical protein